MYEVELKCRADHDRLRDRLDRLGAERRGTVTQRDTYYDAPHREFTETDEALRIRHEFETGDPKGRTDGTPITRLTYKGPLVETASKTRTEHETEIVDPEPLQATLEALGFDPAAIVEKERTRYRIDGYTVTLDDVSGLGEFVEIERHADPDELDQIRDGAIELLERLGVDPETQTTTSYLELLLSDDSGTTAVDAEEHSW